jgi:hypothetical protein
MLHVGRNIVYQSLYKPCVQRYIAELEAQRSSELIQHSIGLLEAAEEAARERLRVRREAGLLPPRPTAEHIAKWKAAGRAWHISQGHKVKDIENE